MKIGTKTAETDTPGHICPSCDRFIGPVDACPYCDADSARSPFLRTLRYGALLLALVGLALLYLMVTRTDVTLVEAGRITPMMDFAYVRITGKVERKAYTATEKGKVDYVSFSVDDGSGSLRVTAYGDVARDLARENRVPERGALVDVAGSLNVPANGRPRLRLLRADQLKITGEE